MWDLDLYMWGLDLYASEYLDIIIAEIRAARRCQKSQQIRRHKRKRINKKWAKRYGYKKKKTNIVESMINDGQIH